MNQQDFKSTTVEICKWSDLSLLSLTKSLREFRIIDSIKKVNKLIIKVNLAAGNIFGPETAVVTNPKILRLLIETLLSIQANLNIFIVESDSIGRGFAAQKFQFQKYSDLFCDLTNVKLYDLSHSPIEVFPCKGKYFKGGIILPKLFKEVDFFISLAKMKTHINTVITGCLKNQFGCLPEWDKEKYHPYLPSVIADINLVIRPDFCILEGCPAMEGNGPIFGTTIDSGMILLGLDPVAVDSTAARIMGFKPEKIAMLREAERAGIGTFHEERIAIRGIPWKQISTKFRFISMEQALYVKLGFMIQRFADLLNKIGHQVHLVKNTKWLIYKVFLRIIKRGKHGTSSWCV